MIVLVRDELVIKILENEYIGDAGIQFLKNVNLYN